MSTRFRIIDPLGAVFYDGTPVPITTGIELYKGVIYGLDGLRSRATEAQLIELKRRIFEGLPGTVGRFVLEVECVLKHSGRKEQQ